MALAQHPEILGTRTLHWPDEAACAASAARLAAAPGLWPSSFLALQGPLGAGKTTFARHLLRALGVQGRIKSPTFAVLEPYEVAQGAISHIDFSRFGDAREWEDAGGRELFAASGLKLAEWPDKAAPLLPAADWQVQIEPLDGVSREVTVHAMTAHGVELLDCLP